MPNLTGHQRYELTYQWIKRGREGDKEEFIQKVCTAKGITYIKPTHIDRKQNAQHQNTLDTQS